MPAMNVDSFLSRIPRKRVPSSSSATSSPTSSPHAATAARVAMSLNPEPADPVEREESHLPPKSYADAAEEGLQGHGVKLVDIDEESIKESPPRSHHSRNSSEPRPLGEIMDEAEMSPGLSPNSPSLRHVRGRIENSRSSMDSFSSIGRRSPDVHVAGALPGLFAGGSINGHANGNARQSFGEKAVETFDGVGEDETPKSPIRKAHKRISSRSLQSSVVEKQNGLPLSPKESSEAEVQQELSTTQQQDTQFDRPRTPQRNLARTEQHDRPTTPQREGLIQDQDTPQLNNGTSRRLNSAAPRPDEVATNGDLIEYQPTLPDTPRVDQSEVSAADHMEANGTIPTERARSTDAASVDLLSSENWPFREAQASGGPRQADTTGGNAQTDRSVNAGSKASNGVVKEPSAATASLDESAQQGLANGSAQAQEAETGGSKSTLDGIVESASAMLRPKAPAESEGGNSTLDSVAESASSTLGPSAPAETEEDKSALDNVVESASSALGVSAPAEGEEDKSKLDAVVESAASTLGVSDPAETEESKPTLEKVTEPSSSAEPATASGDTEQPHVPGEVVQEKLTSKSGGNLASIVPDTGYELALKQDKNKPRRTRPGAPKRLETDLVSGRRAGAGWSQSAIRWAPLNVPLQRRLQTLLVLLHTLSIAGSLALFFLFCTIPLLWPLLMPYLLYVLLSRAGTSGDLGHRSEWLRHSRIWSLFGSYYPARLHRSQELEPTRKYIFGYHPHGIISHGAFAAFATEALGFSQMFPGITNTLLTLDSNFRIPLYRDYALRMGLASVSRESCENILSKGGRNGEGMGRAITIVVGGARESLDAKPYTLRLVLKRRKGFVKLAIRTGADLVPVLAFGENDLYDQFDAAGHPYVHKAQLLVKKFMGFTIPLFHARGMYSTYALHIQNMTGVLTWMKQASSTTT